MIGHNEVKAKVLKAYIAFPKKELRRPMRIVKDFLTDSENIVIIIVLILRLTSYS